MPRLGRFTPGNDPVPIVQVAGWAPGPVWTGAENLAATGMRSPDRPSCSESLSRPRYVDCGNMSRKCSPSFIQRFGKDSAMSNDAAVYALRNCELHANSLLHLLMLIFCVGSNWRKDHPPPSAPPTREDVAGTDTVSGVQLSTVS